LVWLVPIVVVSEVTPPSYFVLDGLGWEHSTLSTEITMNSEIFLRNSIDGQSLPKRLSRLERLDFD